MTKKKAFLAVVLCGTLWAGASQMKLSGLAAINPTTLLVLERTDLVAKL